MSSGARPVIHLVAADIARGAQAYVRELRAALDREGEPHRVWTLFGGDAGILQAEEVLRSEPGPWRRFGLDVPVVRRLAARLEDAGPAVLVAHGGEPLKYAALALRGRSPLVYLKIGVATDDVQRPARRRLHRWLVGRADRVVCVSEDARIEARDLLGVPADRLAVIPNGRDPARFSPGQRPPGRETVRLVFVGHLTESKRPDVFVDLVERLRREDPRVEGVVVGDGPMFDQLGGRAEEAGVRLLGRRMDVPDQLREGDIFVFTSVKEGEGMPGVLIEASLAGLPVVTTDVPGARAVVEDGRTGRVVAVDDIGGLHEAVAGLVRDPEVRTAMGEAARARAVELYSFKSTLDDWRAIIAGVQDPVTTAADASSG